MLHGATAAEGRWSVGLLVFMEKDALRKCPERNANYVCKQIWTVECSAKDKSSSASGTNRIDPGSVIKL
jgi:hypothetical protein